jgi:AcrR family transcriptional regulator
LPPVHRTRNRERTLGNIVVAARAEFAARGYAGARMEQIAQRAGVKKELIYHYFRGKEELFEEVRTSQLKDGHVLPQSPLADWTRDPTSLFAWRFNRMVGNLEWVKLLTWEAVQTDVAPPPNEDSRRATIRQSIADIKKAQKDGSLPADLDPRFLQLAMFALATYPLAFSQITAMTTGMTASDKHFQTAWTNFLRQLGERLLGRRSPSSTQKRATPARTASKGKA